MLGQAQSGEETTTITSEPVTKGQPVTVVQEPGAKQPAPPTRKSDQYYSLILIALMFVVMYMLLFRAPRKKQQQHQRMVQSLQRNDKVQTIGGIIGTVVDVKDNEITLKVDEANNTKIKVVSSAIGRNLSQDKS
jgi:preprotein translocase subunit YajC